MFNFRLGEKILLDQLGVRLINEIYDRDMIRNLNLKENISSVNYTLLMHGGGNFGDIWRFKTILRNSIIRLFSHYKIILMPQTINYRNNTLIKFDNDIYSKASDLIIMARSLDSFNFSKRMFPKIKSFFVPDLAFMIGDVKPLNKPIVNILVLRRTDREKRFNIDIWNLLLKKKLANNYSYLVSKI